MRSSLARCLVVILSLALASGNAHAAFHFADSHHDPCAEGHAHHTGLATLDHQKHHDNGLACCCDCLGCAFTAYLAPELSITPIEHLVRAHYDALTAVLSGRTLLPEPDPPRAGALN
jgi:hypothetical protein